MYQMSFIWKIAHASVQIAFDLRFIKLLDVRMFVVGARLCYSHTVSTVSKPMALTAEAQPILTW